MSKGTRVKVNVDLTGLNRRFSPERLKQARDGLGEQMLGDVMPMIPKRRGTLRDKTDYNQARGVIESRTPYARRQFYNRAAKYTTPGTGPRWDLKAKSRYGKQYRQQVADFLTKE